MAQSSAPVSSKAEIGFPPQRTFKWNFEEGRSRGASRLARTTRRLRPLGGRRGGLGEDDRLGRSEGSDEEASAGYLCSDEPDEDVVRDLRPSDTDPERELAGDPKVGLGDGGR